VATENEVDSGVLRKFVPYLNLIAATAVFIAFIIVLHFLALNSIISFNAYSLGSHIAWIPYFVLLQFASPKTAQTSWKLPPLKYVIADAVACLALLVFTYFLVSNSIITNIDYNQGMFYIMLGFFGTYLIMYAVTALREWMAKRKSAK
jgi:hypothetical protein